MKDGVRIAVVGAGAIAQLTHIPVLSKLRGASLVALCDNDGAKARALADHPPDRQVRAGDQFRCTRNGVTAGEGIALDCGVIKS